MKNLVLDIVDSFQVAQNKARFSALIYSEYAEVGFRFVKFDNAKEVKQAIRALRHIKSGTRVDRALEIAKQDIFR